ncbi:non-ribosomal peptide synthetase [Nonomuraea sediminis]|uniref:non-ribosomal peptide synthetase n=1 Tax=Nonomuraea sediminis TaxID=2835864 RepID=UPI001BDD7F84|nr:non-ribosomal peptide synthetase [Nonomuraea sediminis]
MKLEGVEDIYGLSPLQEGILFHNLYEPGTGVYVEQITMTFEGNLDRSAFDRAWHSMIQRHPIFRTSFHWREVGKSVQVVHERADLDIVDLDWSPLPPDEQDRRLRELALADRLQGFDYTEAPLMRMTLIRLADSRRLFFWSFAHILMDGWSFGLAFQEFADGYNAFAQGREPDLTPARSYRDYVAWWQRQDTSQAEAFWRENLAGFEPPSPLDLGSADAGSPGEEPTHRVVPDVDLGDLVPKLDKVAREHGLTLNTIMQGAWSILLSRYLRHDDVVAGSTGTQRPSGLPGAEHIIGPMLATIPVRATLDQDEQLVAWLRRLQASMAEAREHGNISVPDIRACAGLPASVPLLETDLAFENVPVPEMELYGVRIAESTYDGRPHFPIIMIIVPGEGLPPRMVFDARRFPEPAVERLLGHFHTILDSIAEDPTRAIGEVEMLPEEERRLLDTTTPQPTPRRVDEMFAEQAARTPDAVAVECDGDRLTYRELAERADRLAARLIDHGIGPGDRVALLVERSTDLIAAILGTWRAGAAYVPLGVDEPRERLEYIIGDSAARALVTHGHAAGSDVPVIDLNTLGTTEPARHEPRGTADDLAYVLYTSGSTGRPKGVLVTHANVSRLLTASGEHFDRLPGDGWAMFHAYTFDVSVFETWGALTTGGRLVIVPLWVTRSPDLLDELLRESRVAILCQTPSAFRSWQAYLLEGTDQDRPADLRHIVLAGEYLDGRTVEPWLTRFGDERPRLVNMYGPTEASVYATYHRITRADLDRPTRSNIGKPLADLRIHLLDQHLRPVPAGVPGELCISGPGVAHGYQNLPELTERCFLPDPFVLGERMYRSGDLARRTQDGDIEFLGRIDFQVKVRGFRVEPGEVESVLRSCDTVKDTVVTAHENAPGDVRLAAYVVPSTSVEEADLRTAVQERLPEYMVPAYFVLLDELPLTPSGKVDRAALPEPGGTRAGVGEYVAPRTEVEERVARVWSEVLGVDRVGVHDDFFALGGHSLLATRVAFGLRAELGIEVQVRTLFEHPTVAALAETLDGGKAEAGATTIIARPRVEIPS